MKEARYDDYMRAQVLDVEEPNRLVEEACKISFDQYVERFP